MSATRTLNDPRAAQADRYKPIRDALAAEVASATAQVQTMLERMKK